MLYNIKPSPLTLHKGWDIESIFQRFHSVCGKRNFSWCDGITSDSKMRPSFDAKMGPTGRPHSIYIYISISLSLSLSLSLLLSRPPYTPSLSPSRHPLSLLPCRTPLCTIAPMPWHTITIHIAVRPPIARTLSPSSPSWPTTLPYLFDSPNPAHPRSWSAPAWSSWNELDGHQVLGLVLPLRKS